MKKKSSKYKIIQIEQSFFLLVCLNRCIINYSKWEKNLSRSLRFEIGLWIKLQFQQQQQQSTNIKSPSKVSVSAIHHTVFNSEMSE